MWERTSFRLGSKIRVLTITPTFINRYPFCHVPKLMCLSVDLRNLHRNVSSRMLLPGSHWHGACPLRSWALLVSVAGLSATGSGQESPTQGEALLLASCRAHLNRWKVSRAALSARIPSPSLRPRPVTCKCGALLSTGISLRASLNLRELNKEKIQPWKSFSTMSLTASHPTPNPTYSSIKQLTTELILESCPYQISLEVSSENASRKVVTSFLLLL